MRQDKDDCKMCAGTGKRDPENTGAQFACVDCGRMCGDYMVHDLVWLEAYPTYPAEKRKLKKLHASKPFMQYLRVCVSCLGKRLGRPLRLSDFTFASVNDVVRAAYRMGVQAQVRKQLG